MRVWEDMRIKKMCGMAWIGACLWLRVTFSEPNDGEQDQEGFGAVD